MHMFIAQMANLLNNSLQHGITVSQTMPIKSEEMEPYVARHYMSTSDEVREENPYEAVYDGNDLQSSSNDNFSKNSDEDGAVESEEDSKSNCDLDSSLAPVETESDSLSDSSSSGSSSSFGSTTDSIDEPDSTDDPSVCTLCGQGPFKNIKIHLIHCIGKVTHQCSVCNKTFHNEQAQLKHRVRYHVCFLCSEVFIHWSHYRSHVCPKGPKPLSPTIFWSCSRSLPNKCNFCKAFFATKNSLLNHKVIVHSTMVTSKVCIITDPALLLPIETALPLETQSAQGSSGLVSDSQCRRTVNQNTNGDISTLPKLANGDGEKNLILNKVIRTYLNMRNRKPQMTTKKENVTANHPSSLSSHHKSMSGQYASQPLRKTNLSTPLTTTKLSVQTDTNGASSQASTQSPQNTCKPETLPIIQPSPSVVRMFRNKSQELSLKKRMDTSWRSKTPYPCRQCGAISRQPSLIVAHRYLHRGRRAHRCQCGRSFLHRLHLLRHCMQHAEATSYICVNCGETFIGAKLLVEHLKGNSRKSSSGVAWKERSGGKCRVPLCCDCGLHFDRPSAYIWHQLQNMKKDKDHKKRLK